MNFTEAVIALRPNESWTLKGLSTNVSDIIWTNPDVIPPTQKEVDDWIAETKAKKTIEIFNEERQKLMAKYDWYYIRKIRTGQAVPTEVDEYMESLANLDKSPDFAPKLTVEKRRYIIDKTSVNFPTEPQL